MVVSKVIAVASGKGGVGKTTIAVNLGVALALHGKKARVLDADIAMANVSLHVGLDDVPVTLHEVLAGDADVGDAIYHVMKNFEVVPCGVTLSGFQKATPDRLRDVVIDLIEGVDYLIIDSPPGLNRDSILPIAIAEEVLLVANPDIASIIDTAKTKAIADLIGTNVYGTVINKATFSEKSVAVAEIGKTLETEIVAVIPEDPEVRKALMARRPVLLYNKKAPASRAFMSFAERMIGETPAYYDEDLFREKEESILSRFIKAILRKK